MKTRKLKKEVVYGIYAFMFLAVLGVIYMIEQAVAPASLKEEEKYHYVSKTIFDEELPVVNTTVKVIRPYTDTNVKIVKDYYDYQSEAEKQQNSLIYHENTYLQNSGVSYGGVESPFDVVSILDGTVIDVKEDQLLGNIVEVRHSNDLISVYQSLGEVSVKKNDEITQGQVIGKSGTSNISKELNQHLHFELIIKGQIVNPESYYDKAVSEL